MGFAKEMLKVLGIARGRRTGLALLDTILISSVQILACIFLLFLSQYSSTRKLNSSAIKKKIYHFAVCWSDLASQTMIAV